MLTFLILWYWYWYWYYYWRWLLPLQWWSCCRVVLKACFMLPAHFFFRWSASVSMKKESQSNHITSNGVENMCAALKINAVLVPQMPSESLRPLPSRAGPLPRFPEERPPAPRLWNDCKPNSQVLADPRLLVFFRHPLSLATKVTSCTLMRNQISARGPRVIISVRMTEEHDIGACVQWMLPPTHPKAALDHAGGRVFSVR